MSLNNNKRRRTRTGSSVAASSAATLDATIQKAETRQVKGDNNGQKSVKQLKNKNYVFKTSSGKASISMSCTCHNYTLLRLQKGASRWGEQQEKDEESVFLSKQRTPN